MTTIQHIGNINVAKHGPVYLIHDKRDGTTETFSNYRDARDRAVEKADLVDVYAALSGETRH